MLSAELEALAADVIDVLGVTLKAAGIARRLKRLASVARELEHAMPNLTRAVFDDERIDAGNVESLEHARRQKRLSTLAKPIGGNDDRGN